MSIDDNPMAFPITSSTGDSRDGVYCQTGMTLRDFFAAHVIQGMAASENWSQNFDNRDGFLEPVAAIAYRAADAMLAERSKQQTT